MKKNSVEIINHYYSGVGINGARVLEHHLEFTQLIGASLSEPHIDWHNGPRGGECIYLSIYLSRGSVCPFQCSREVGNALFSTCAHYNWRLVSNKIPGILAMMQMTQGRQKQRSDLKSNNFRQGRY